MTGPPSVNQWQVLPTLEISDTLFPMKESYKQNFIRAGAIAKEVRAFGKTLIQKGASYNGVIEQIQQKIVDLGAIAAFPPQIAFNEVAAHFLPQPEEDLLFSDQLVKLDVGVCFNGAIGDCAVSIDLSGRHQHIIDAAEAALLNAEKIIKVGLPLREIGKVVETTILSFGLQPIRNLCGHGLGFYRVHTPPLIPNYEDRSKGVVQPGMTFAIEPFATSGKGLIHEGGTATIFSFVKEKPLTSSLERSLVDKIQTFKGLPFSIHDLLKVSENPAQTKEAIQALRDAGVITGYPPLIEETKGWVAQAENSILVDAAGKVFVTTR